MAAPHANICIYAFTEGYIDLRLPADLRRQLTTAPLHFHALGDLLIHLKSPATTDDVLVLLPQRAEELSDLMAHKRLQDRRLVLILPDSEEATLSRAHLLGPRYLCFAEDIGDDLVAVLNKMVARPRLKRLAEGVAG